MLNRLGGLVERVNKHKAMLNAGIARRNRDLEWAKGDHAEGLKLQVEHWKKELDNFEGSGLAAHMEKVSESLQSDADAKRVDIIILKYKIPKIEIECINRIIWYTQWPHKVTWIDTRNWSANFSRIWNKLIWESTCDYTLIADSDAFVTANGWLTTMMSSFDTDFECRPHPQEVSKIYPNRGNHKGVGVVAPVTHTGGASTIQGGGQRTFPEPFITEAQVSGFFFLFKREVWLDVGPFDERFYLHGQDSEWMDRVLDSSWGSVIRPDVFVDHKVSASIKKSVEDGEFDLGVDLEYTKIIYDMIREEKEQGCYIPVAEEVGLIMEEEQEE